MDTNTFVATVAISLADKLKTDLTEQGFEFSSPPYTVFSAKKKGVSCTLYQTGKLTVQGKDKQSFIEFYLEPEILKDFSYSHKETLSSPLDLTGKIGIDESGKGDFFGPLCIAGVFAEGNALVELKTLGVRDSKTLSNDAIIKIGKKIKSNYAHHIIRLKPSTYNNLYSKFHNLNSLLAWGHATTIEELVKLTGCRHAVIDQFASEHVVLNALKKKNLEIDLVQQHRGEQVLVVAAASILARQAFVEGMDELSHQIGMSLPKGASRQVVAVGKAFIEKYGYEALGSVAKIHFKTANEIRQ